MIFEDRLSRPSLYPNENKRIDYKNSTYSVCKKMKVERQKVQRSMMRPPMKNVNDEMEVHDQIEMTRQQFFTDPHVWVWAYVWVETAERHLPPKCTNFGFFTTKMYEFWVFYHQSVRILVFFKEMYEYWGVS